MIHPTTFQKIVQGNQYTVFILSAKDKQFAIYTTPQVGDYVQRLFSDAPANRPQTLDLLGSVMNGLNVVPLQLVLHDLQNAIYFCKLFLSQSGPNNEQQIREIDTRPSDGLAIALMYNLPIYSTQDLLDKAAPYQDTP